MSRASRCQRVVDIAACGGNIFDLYSFYSRSFNSNFPYWLMIAMSANLSLAVTATTTLFILMSFYPQLLRCCHHAAVDQLELNNSHDPNISGIASKLK